VEEAAVGEADRETKRSNSASTRFNIGSINKTVTAVAIAQLVERRLLNFQDVVGNVLPDYPNKEVASKVSIHHLLTHSAGVSPSTTQFPSTGNKNVPSLQSLVQTFAAQPLRFQPGTRQEYSNAGYVLLGRIVEVVSGQNYEDYVREHVYKPAGMKHTTLEPVRPPDPSAAIGYLRVGPDGRPVMIRPGSPPSDAATTTLVPNTSMLEPGNSAGGGYSTASDLIAFARALRGGRLFGAAMTDFLLNGTFSGADGPKYGYALREEMVNGRRFLGNGGGAPGINAEFRFEPGGGLVVVALSNISPPSATNMLRRVLEQMLQ
jgi:CubicO group peptidase (beta-lactamase class C family)